MSGRGKRDCLTTSAVAAPCSGCTRYITGERDDPAHIDGDCAAWCSNCCELCNRPDGRLRDARREAEEVQA
jgi:hypothetical protein